MKPWGLATSCAIIALTATAQAQKSVAAAPAVKSGSESPTTDLGGSQVEEVVVTAQRRAEPLQSVPIAVTATTAAQLEQAGITSTEELPLLTPGLSVAQTAGYEQPRIRGVGSTVDGPGFESPVATYVDGVYMTAAPASLMTLNDISRVEVLKGPQGTLFGRNATGGLIQVITKDPEQTPSADVRVTYANYQDATADAYVTGGIAHSLAADLAVRYERQGQGWGTNLGTGNPVGWVPHDFAARTKWLFEPAEGTTLRLSVDYENRASSRQAQEPVGRFYPIPFDNPAFGGPFRQGGHYDIDTNLEPLMKLQGGGASLQVNQSFGSVALQSITAYRKSNFDLTLDVDYVPVPVTSLYDLARNDQFSEELQLSSTDPGRLKWVAGLFYFYSDDKNDPEYIDFGPTFASPVTLTPVRVSVLDKQLTDSYAGYAQATYEILPATNLTLGGRYTRESKRLSGVSDFLIAGNLAATTPLPNPASGISDELTFNRFNYRVALDHKITSDILGYVSYSTGFKSGGFNLNLPTDPPYKPEAIGAAEVGLKTKLFDRRVRLNTSGYYYTYTNLQVGRYINSNTSIYNGPRAKIYGFDFDGEFVVSKPLSLTAGLAYTHARFASFPVADSVIPVAGCVPAPGSFCSGSATGKTLPFTPEVTFNVGADYRVDLPGGSLLALNATYYFSSRFYGAPDNISYQPSYGLVNAAVTWSDPSGHFSARVWGKNLANALYTTTILESTTGNAFSYGDPRTYGLTLRYQF